MQAAWIVTPYFFDEHDAALVQTVPASTPFRLNDPGGIAGRSAAEMGEAHRAIAGFVEKAATLGKLSVSIAGDCCASLPVMAGLQHAGLDPILVWLDAHGDFNTHETSPSGFLGGMPLAMMVGRGDLSLAGETGLRSVPEEDVWLIDGRDLDPLEAKALDASRVNRRGMEDLKSLVFERPVHLHIDNDVIDARHVPANNYPVPDGPSLTDTIRAATAFAARNAVCAISFSGWNGRLDRDGKTGKACARLLASIVQEAP